MPQRRFWFCLPKVFVIVFLPLVLLPNLVFSQGADWITHPAARPGAYGVFHFRKVIGFQRLPQHFVVRVSADPRYRLFVNGKSVSVGPAKSNVEHWKYERLDLAPFLKTGKNVLAAVVWNDGENSAWSQVSAGTGFFMEGSTQTLANTNHSWKVLENQAYVPLATIQHITGAGEQVFGQRYPWGWETPDFDDSHWLVPVSNEQAGRARPEPEKPIPMPVRTKKGKPVLQPPQADPVGQLPQPEETLQRFPGIRRWEGLPDKPEAFLNGQDLLIPTGTHLIVLLDQTYLTTAYPSLQLSGGSGAKITLTYAEALFDKNGNKGNRNDIENKTIQGNQDVFLPDGGDHRLFQPHSYRTFRYLELNIQSHQQSLILHDFYSLFTAYPFQEKAVFKTDDPLLTQLWNTGWRTARLCAFDTYMDCPYYEQLQYIGDTRIQALVSLYVSGDDRLMKNAISQFQESMLAEGITQSRYPSRIKQVIPPFSLFWVQMVHDFWMHRTDEAFVKKMLPGIRKVLDWHKKYLNDRQLLGKMPYWNFVDWTTQWTWTGTEETSGVPEGALTGNSAILTMQYVMALQKAAELYNYYGLSPEATAFLQTATDLKTAVFATCWDADKNYVADTPDKTSFSQHAQALAVLTGTLPARLEAPVMLRTLADTTLVQCSFYYRFYLLQALKKAGLGNNYMNQLTPWKKMLENGLTTFAEKPDPTRSDCHAWSASPVYEMLATVCGIMPGSPGFQTVRIEPNLGNLTVVDASMPHPVGEIKVSYRVTGGRFSAEVILPKGVLGIFVRDGKKYALKSGKNRL